MRTRKKSKTFAGDYRQCQDSKLAIGLIRGSTAEQLNTLLVQENTIRAYATNHGFDLLELITDSGTSAEKIPFFQRPKALEALAAMGCSLNPQPSTLNPNQVFHLFVTKTDRAFRNHEDCIVTCRVLWEDYGISVHFIDENLVSSNEKDQLVLQIRASVAEQENRARRDRQFAALVVMRQNRERCGHYEPYGWMIDPDRVRTTRRSTQSDYLVPEPTEQAGLARLFSLVREGFSTSKTARILNAEGIRPKGKPCWRKRVTSDLGPLTSEPRGVWYASTVQSALEHGQLSDGTHCVVENRGGRLHFEFRNPQSEVRNSSIAA